MPVIVSLLRGVNVGGNRKIKMDTLRALCESLGWREAQTLLQSGNVVFRAQARGVASLPGRLEDAIEQSCGFRTDVIVRTCSELRDVVARNPFARRSGIDPSKLLVTFLVGHPGAEACGKLLAIQADPEELRIDGRELYIYFPNGIARPKLSPALIEKTLRTSGTGRNWNTVRKLLEIAERLESGR